jgi:hypothetical protein
MLGCGAVCMAVCGPAFATVQIMSFKSSVTPGVLIGTPVTFTVTATDSTAGPLTFQFNVGVPRQALSVARDFNVGTLSSGTWTNQPFTWVPTGVEGTYQIQVVIKDWGSGQTASRTIGFQVNPLVTGSTPVAVTTQNPLVALFSAPSCAKGSSMRVEFQPLAKTSPPSYTNWINCHPPGTMTFEVAGMYASTAYQMFAQTKTGSKITNGATVSFSTGAIPTSVPVPTFQVLIPAGTQTYTTYPMLLVNPVQLAPLLPYIQVAIDLSGNVMWYYYVTTSSTHFNLLARPLPNGGMLTIQDGPAWNPATQSQQLIRQIDLMGNVVRETNIGLLQQQLLAMGATNANPCNLVPQPAPVGAACAGAFHHEFVQGLPNGGLAVFVDIEKIFPPGTQGDTSGRPVDIVGDMIIVLNSDWQVAWYFDSFDHDSGAPQLDINRPAVLGETCVVNQSGCPPIFLLGPNTAPTAKDWLHANTIYYWPSDHDLVWSSRHQDWVMKVDYNDGAGTGNILWRMGNQGDFAFNNINGDPWPWFSHQHDVQIAKGGAGPMTIYDNGNTRVSQVGSGNSRCMALNVDEASMKVTPAESADLGVFSTAMGSAQLLPNGNYYCFSAIVVQSLRSIVGFGQQLAGSTQVLDVQGSAGYRGWQMLNLYSPPAN